MKWESADEDEKKSNENTHAQRKQNKKNPQKNGFYQAVDGAGKTNELLSPIICVVGIIAVVFAGIILLEISHLGDKSSQATPRAETAKATTEEPLTTEVPLTLAATVESSAATEDYVYPPANAEDLKNQNFEEVKTYFEDSGFINISVKKDEDLILGFLHDEGDVESVTINGNSSFEATSSFKPEAKVVITYHAYQPEFVDDEEDAVSASEADAVEEQADTVQESETQVLSVENSPELSALLSLKDPFDSSVAAFASKYAGQTIEFDGNIADMTRHEGYKTRFDFLVYAGNYDPNSVSGPYFQFNDCNIYDLNTELGSVSAGTNVHIVAKVGSYNSNTGLFQLKPVKVSGR